MGTGGTPGASLFGWSKYFPNAKIYGGDIDKRVLFTTPRIKTFYCDQMKVETINNLFNKTLNNIEFDIIIEDGLHTYLANYTFLTNTIHKLKKGGIYITEDIGLDTFMKLHEKLDEIQTTYNLSYMTLIKIPGTNKSDNNMLIIVK
jgi:hypothetical protein